MKTPYNRVASQLGGLHFSVGSPTSMAAAIQVNEHLPVVAIRDQYEFISHWSSDVIQTARAEIEKMARFELVDTALTLEMTKQVYRHRCTLAADPLYILFHIMAPWNYKEEFMEDPMFADTHLINTAFYYIIETVHSNRADMNAYFNEFNYSGTNKRLVNQVIDNIYNVFDRDLKNVSADHMAAYHNMIRRVITDMFDLYKANHSFHKINEPRYSALLTDQVEAALQGTFCQSDLAAFVNTFYDKEVLKREYGKDKDEELHEGYLRTAGFQPEEQDTVPDHGLNGMDQESMDDAVVEHAWEDINSFIGSLSAQADCLESRIDTIHKEGANRADAIELLGLDPIKDKAALARFPVTRSGDNQEVSMGLLKGLKKLGRNVIRSVLQLVETVITKVLRFFGTPFGIKASFTITSADKALVKWGETFNKPIHDFLEKRNPIVEDERLARNVITQALETLTDTVEDMLTHAEDIDKEYKEDKVYAMENHMEQMNTAAHNNIKNFNDAIRASGIFTNIIETTDSSIDYKHESGEVFESFSTLNALQDTHNAEKAIREMSARGVSKREVTVESIETLMGTFKDPQHYEDIRLEIRDAAQTAMRRLRRVRTAEFDFLKASSNKYAVDYMAAKSFNNQAKAIRDMAYTIKGIADVYGVVSRELETMIVTYEANFKEK